ncbi:hypothetical protein A2V49_03085 [candidate division WWE3 bacterium RBG_19FT_COMBO_34_6]|uniref:Uncharacterized protein n=1 Tax=candidate division WWE3 bacterium RBG_19FT_COMBO_34_6 TaxID=1802612 RepID=A0A1F4UKJ2_UNCKA|nr:MAG: hypothetical protein A2V49_03085 [candidate division WWE3 bacterium RBG_19FT_COMBO_34_6]
MLKTKVTTKCDDFVITRVDGTNEFFYYKPKGGNKESCAEFALISNLESGSLPKVGQEIIIFEKDGITEFVLCD